MQKISLFILSLVFLSSCEKEIVNLAIGKKISASASNADAGPQNAIDGNKNTMWSSGQYGKQSIEIDLGGSFDIKRFELLCTTTPPSEPEIEIEVKSKDNPNYTQIIKRTEKIKDWDSLVYHMEQKNISHVRLSETNNQSHVAFLEFRIFGN